MTLTPMEQIEQAGVALNLSHETMIALMAIMNADRADFKKFEISVLRDDANPTVAHPGGTSWADATVTHTKIYQSAFPEDETDLFVIWGAQGRVTSPAVSGTALAHVLLASGTTLISNVEYIGHDAGDGYDYIRGSVGGFAKITKPAGDTSYTIEQRVYITGTDTTSTCAMDNMDLTIFEVKK